MFKPIFSFLILATLPAFAIVKSGNIPSGKIPVACQVPMTPEQLVDCYLKDPSSADIAANVRWQFPTGPLSWSQWPEPSKQDLRTAFKNTVTWYQGGMVSYPGTLVQDPPALVNVNALMAGQSFLDVVDGPTVAWPLYVGQVALSLASEIYGWVPWSLHNFDLNTLGSILNSNSQEQYCLPASGYDGYCYTGGATPSNATYMFRFLKQNNLIGSTRLDTISRLLEWSRSNLVHFSGPYTTPPVRTGRAIPG